jgi:hypothetical protein
LKERFEKAALDAGKTQSEFGKEAIERALTAPTPSSRGVFFQRPKSRDEFPLEEFFQGARVLAYTGFVLSALWEGAFVQFLMDMIEKEHREMTFVAFYPYAEEHEPAFDLLTRRHRALYNAPGEEKPVGLRGAILATLKALQKLGRVGNEHDVPIHIRVSGEYPILGFSIINPSEVRYRMRVRQYLQLRSHTIHPFWEIDTGTEEGASVGAAFREHYDHIINSSRELVTIELDMLIQLIEANPVESALPTIASVVSALARRRREPRPRSMRK